MLKPIFVATDLEIISVLENKEYGFKQVLEKPFRVWQNDTRILIETGIGLVNSAAAFYWAVEKFKFDEAINVGAAGLCICDGVSEDERKSMLAKFYDVKKVTCLEPYNDFSYELSESGKTLVSSSRTVESEADRKFAGLKGELVDMECYALARAADITGKKLIAKKLVTDFSAECDIFKNIRELQHHLAAEKSLWI